MSQSVQQNPIFEIGHPLIRHKLSILRDKTTNKKNFKELVNEITLLLVYEATRELALEKVQIETPLETTTSYKLQGLNPLVVPILRAGIGMVDAFLSLMPTARVGHIGLFRDETTHKPVEYYFKIPSDADRRFCFVCDPMLATGGSASAALSMLKEKGIKDFAFVCLVAAPEGVKELHGAHPDVPIYTASLDRGLNDDCYILPGLGDAGDRLFGTI